MSELADSLASIATAVCKANNLSQEDTSAYIKSAERCASHLMLFRNDPSFSTMQLMKESENFQVMQDLASLVNLVIAGLSIGLTTGYLKNTMLLAMGAFYIYGYKDGANNVNASAFDSFISDLGFDDPSE